MAQKESQEFVEWSFNGRSAELSKKWKNLTEGQKKVLEKNFPIGVGSHILVFFFPGIFLLYARQYWIYLGLLISSIFPPLQLVLRIIIVIYWESLCYNGESPNMKDNLIANKEAWDNKEGTFNENVQLSKVGASNVALIVCLVFIGFIFIGILSAALLPRMQGAQGAARDAARRSDLSQLGSAVLSYFNNKGEYPGANNAETMMPASNIQDELLRVVDITTLPTDPNRDNSFEFNGKTISNGQYGYMVYDKGGYYGYALMAKTETEGGSNFVYDGGNNTDITKLCNTFKKGDKVSNINGTCTYSSKDQLRYVYYF